MTYSEALFFTSKCLTLGLYPERIPEIRAEIRSGSVDWEQVVWVSTGQFVFATLYIQLQRAGLLSELPEDLVEYMEEYTDLNRIRNQSIIDEALKVTALLNEKRISPIFLKGTAHLLDNLYEDIAERVVGDIDFLVEPADMMTAVEILQNLDFEISENYDPKYLKYTKHYPRLRNENWVGAFEVHHQILIYPHYKNIESSSLIERKKKLNLGVSAFVLSDQDQILHNILNIQINDYGYYFGNISLRQSYDLLLLSTRESPLRVIRGFKSYFNCMNANLALANMLFNNPSCLKYESNLYSWIFLNRINRHINNPRWATFSYTSLNLFHVLQSSLFRDLGLLIQTFSNKEARSHVVSRLLNPKWYLTHFKSYIKN